MKTALFSLMFIVVFLYSVPTAEAVEQYDIISEKWIQNDTRLSKKITLNIEQHYLADVFYQVEKQSGIKLEVSHNEPMSGSLLTVLCNKIEVHELLNAIWSALSYQGGTVQWLKISTDSQPRYRLVSGYSKRQPEIMKQKGRKYFLKQLDTFIKISKLPPDKREAMDKEFSEAFMNKSYTWLRWSGKHTNDSASMKQAETFLAQIRLFAELPKDVQDDIFAGNRFVIPVETLSKQDKDLILGEPSIVEVSNGSSGTSTYTMIFKEVFYHYEEKSSNGRKSLVPTLYFGTPSDTMVDKEGNITKTRTNMTSRSIVGLHGLGYAKYLREGWMLSGDAKFSHYEKQKIIPTNSNKVESHLENEFPEHSSILRDLKELTHQQKFHLVAVLPELRYYAYNASEDSKRPETVGEGLTQLHNKHSGNAFKWRGEVLLVNYFEWFLGDDALIPYSLIKEVRSSIVDNYYIPLKNVGSLIMKLSPLQHKTLAVKFPMLDIPNNLLFWILLYRERPSLLSEEGVSVSEQEFSQIKQHIPGNLIKDYSTGLRFRLREIVPTKGSNEEYLVRLEAKTGSRSWRLLSEFSRHKSK